MFDRVKSPAKSVNDRIPTPFCSFLPGQRDTSESDLDHSSIDSPRYEPGTPGQGATHSSGKRKGLRSSSSSHPTQVLIEPINRPEPSVFGPTGRKPGCGADYITIDEGIDFLNKEDKQSARRTRAQNRSDLSLKVNIPDSLQSEPSGKRGRKKK